MIKNQAKYRATIHSDQGWHYQHNKWVKTLKKHHVFQSMSRKATCADNASMENFFGILKQEMYYGENLVIYEELKQRIEEYIDYYNHKRLSKIDWIKSRSIPNSIQPISCMIKTLTFRGRYLIEPTFFNLFDIHPYPGGYKKTSLLKGSKPIFITISKPFIIYKGLFSQNFGMLEKDNKRGDFMQIYIDADACPVKDIIIDEATKRNYEVTL